MRPITLSLIGPTALGADESGFLFFGHVLASIEWMGGTPIGFRFTSLITREHKNRAHLTQLQQS